MGIEIIQINGPSEYVDYTYFERTVKRDFLGTCKNAKVFLINKFTLNTLATDEIDLLIIVCIKREDRNFVIIKEIEDKKQYLHNLIIPIRFNKSIQDKEIPFNEDNVLEGVNGDLPDENFIDELKYQLGVDFIDILKQNNALSILKLQENKKEGKSLFMKVFPIEFCFNKNKLFDKGLIISPKFGFDSIRGYLLYSDHKWLESYSGWNYPEDYHNIQKEIYIILEHASKYAKFGILTKKKLDRINNSIKKNKGIFKSIGNELVLIKGKAGTGKSSDLRELMVKSLTQGTKVHFLTYNHLLKKETTNLVGYFLRNNRKIYPDLEQSRYLPKTIHKFFYDLSKSLGIQIEMSVNRKEQLQNSINKKIIELNKYLENAFRQEAYITIESLKLKASRNEDFLIEDKDFVLRFLTYIKKEKVSSVGKTGYKSLIVRYKNYCFQEIENIYGIKNIFLKDYGGILSRLIWFLDDPLDYYNTNDIKNLGPKIDPKIIGKTIWRIFELDKFGRKEKNRGEITYESFSKSINYRLGGIKGKGNSAKVFIDEGQDCEPKERDLLFKLFGPENVIVTSGEATQLIRRQDECNWKRTSNYQRGELTRGIDGSKIAKSKVVNKGASSFRIKKNLMLLINYIAKEYKLNIDLKLEQDSLDDVGEIFIQKTEKPLQCDINTINTISAKSETYGYTDNEGLIFLLLSDFNEPSFGSTSSINTYGNITKGRINHDIEWEFENVLNKEGYFIYNGAKMDKRELPTMSSNHTKAIYYNSCRGLESFGVVCMDLNKFFTAKYNDEESETYILDKKRNVSIDFDQKNEVTKKRFAAIWLIMALTRAIDTLFITLNISNANANKEEVRNLDNELIQLIERFDKDYPNIIKWVGKEN